MEKGNKMTYFRDQNDDDFRDLCAQDDLRRDAAEADSEGEGFELPEDADNE